MTVIAIIITAINVCILAALYHRIGKQSVIDALFKAYENVCRLNQCNEILIERLRNELKKYEEVTNEVKTSKENSEGL